MFYLPYYGTCSGSFEAAWFGAGLLTSYLVLFIQFYSKTYKAKGKGTGGGKSSGKMPSSGKSKKKRCVRERQTPPSPHGLVSGFTFFFCFVFVLLFFLQGNNQS
jgi:hypothetical protein